MTESDNKKKKKMGKGNKRGAVFFPTFREQPIKKSLSEIREDIERGQTREIQLTKELVETLLFDNLVKLKPVD